MSPKQRIIIVTVMLLAALAGRGLCDAQDLEVFTDDDFIFPADLHTADGARVFAAARGYIGVDHDYTRRNDTFGQGVQFARLVSNLYYSGWQMTANYTRFAVNPSSVRETYVPGRAQAVGDNTQEMPLSRIGLEMSRYFGREEKAARLKVQMMEERMFSGAYEREIGATLDLKLLGILCSGEEILDTGLSLSCEGGIQYAFRPAQGLHYIAAGWRQHFQVNRFDFMIGEGAGIEQLDGDWRLGVGRIQLGMTVPVVRSTNVRFLYSFVRLGGRNARPNQLKGTSHEVAAFISFPIFAHLF